MKVKEFIEKIISDKNGVMNVSKTIGTKLYLPFEEKVALVKNIVSQSTIEENGFVQIDNIKQYIVFTVETIKSYTELEFDDNYIADYDLLCSSGALVSVINTFEGEYNMILSLVEMEKKRVLSQNSVESQVAQFLTRVSENLSNISDVLSDKINKFDMNISAENMQQINEFINMLK